MSLALAKAIVEIPARGRAPLRTNADMCGEVGLVSLLRRRRALGLGGFLGMVIGLVWA